MTQRSTSDRNNAFTWQTLLSKATWKGWDLNLTPYGLQSLALPRSNATANTSSIFKVDEQETVAPVGQLHNLLSPPFIRDERRGEKGKALERRKHQTLCLKFTRGLHPHVHYLHEDRTASQYVPKAQIRPGQGLGFSVVVWVVQVVHRISLFCCRL